MKPIDALKQWRPGFWALIVITVLIVGLYFSLQILPNRFDRLNAAQTEFNPALPCVSADGFAPEMVALDGGTFMMGSPDTEAERGGDERPQVVTIEAFAISRCEVTFADYQRYVDDLASDEVTLPFDEGWGRGTRPVINVRWLEATSYAAWLTEKTGEEYRLPTEAEWEYAARAVDVESPSSPFNTGSCISSDQANFDSTVTYADCPAGKIKPDRTVEVGKYPPNRWGLYDMHGNVWEWTCSNYQIDYQDSASDCANRVQEGVRVMRGGSWGGYAQDVRSAFRDYFVPTDRFNDVGFRVARAIR